MGKEPALPHLDVAGTVPLDHPLTTSIVVLVTSIISHTATAAVDCRNRRGQLVRVERAAPAAFMLMSESSLRAAQA